MSVFLVIIVLSVLVIIHELGHLFAALWAKIKVEEFGLGYPPKVAKLFLWKGIPFTLNAIPFGGFVRMQGEDEAPGKPIKAGDFLSAALGKRLVVIIAGVVMNAVFGIIILSAVYTSTGIPTPVSDARIGYVLPNTPAEQAGLASETSIVRIQTADRTVDNPDIPTVQNLIQENAGKEVTIVTRSGCEALSCSGQEKSTTVLVRTREATPEGEGLLGIAFQDQVLVKQALWKMPFVGAVYGTKQALFLGKEIVSMLGQLVVRLATGDVPSEVVGPIGIAQQAQSMGLASQGWIVITLFTAMISINLAIMNILPIPPLDGGRLFFLLLEPIIKRNKLAKIEYWANYSGFILLIALIILISARDIWKLFT